jgi:hypothetical protein
MGVFPGGIGWIGHADSRKEKESSGPFPLPEYPILHALCRLWRYRLANDKLILEIVPKGMNVPARPVWRGSPGTPRVAAVGATEGLHPPGRRAGEAEDPGRRGGRDRPGDLRSWPRRGRETRAERRTAGGGRVGRPGRRRRRASERAAIGRVAGGQEAARIPGDGLPMLGRLPALTPRSDRTGTGPATAATPNPVRTAPAGGEAGRPIRPGGTDGSRRRAGPSRCVPVCARLADRTVRIRPDSARREPAASRPAVGCPEVSVIPAPRIRLFPAGRCEVLQISARIPGDGYSAENWA